MVCSIEELYDFEDWVVKTFNDGKLKSPVHLSGSKDGNLERYLIDLFNQIEPEDWVATTYRSHYHALLKGIPKYRLKQWILENKSIHFMDKEYKMFSSAIVGGTLSTALGIAMGIKMNQTNNRVYVFCGDMTSQSGIFHEVFNYSINYNLPIKFIIENNFLSTDTPTAEAWGILNVNLENKIKQMKREHSKYLDYITYERKYPHYGTGKFIAKIWENIDETKQKGF